MKKNSIYSVDFSQEFWKKFASQKLDFFRKPLFYVKVVNNFPTKIKLTAFFKGRAYFFLKCLIVWNTLGLPAFFPPIHWIQDWEEGFESAFWVAQNIRLYRSYLAWSHVGYGSVRLHCFQLFQTPIQFLQCFDWQFDLTILRWNWFSISLNSSFSNLLNSLLESWPILELAVDGDRDLKIQKDIGQGVLTDYKRKTYFCCRDDWFNWM